MTAPLQGWPTKAKEVRLNPMDTNPVFHFTQYYSVFLFDIALSSSLKINTKKGQNNFIGVVVMALFLP